MMMMRAAVVPSPLLLHLLTQARTITSFTPPVVLIRSSSRRQISSSRNHVPTTSSLAMTKQQPSSSSSSTTTTTTTTTTLVSVGGGDHAGLSATFSSTTGELIPVPEHLVPESMVEWGDIPSYLEVLVSEDVLDDDDEQQHQHEMERTTITVLPEVGCGIDNLETTKKVEEYDFDLQTKNKNKSRLVQWKGSSGGKKEEQQEVVVLDRRVGLDQLNLETIFQVDSSVQKEGEEEEKVYPRRIRILFTIDTNTNHIIKDTITLNIERLISTTSTKGTRWSGPQHNSGGLDARSVMHTIGKEIVYGDVFSVKRVKSGEDVWTVMDEAVRNDVVVEGSEDGSSIRLPQNILVQFHDKKESTQSWCIELSHFDVIDESKVYRRSVLRTFDSSQDGFGSVSYREE